MREKEGERINYENLNRYHSNRYNSIRNVWNGGNDIDVLRWRGWIMIWFILIAILLCSEIGRYVLGMVLGGTIVIVLAGGVFLAIVAALGLVGLI